MDKLKARLVKTLPNGRLQIKIKQGEERVVRASSSWAIEKNQVILDIDESELNALIDMLKTCKSKLKERNLNSKKEIEMKAILTKQHFMVDLETLSSQSNAHILETALVCFHPVTGTVYNSKSFHVRHGLDEQLRSHTSTDTLAWWYKTNRGYLAKLLNPTEKQALVDTLRRMKELFDAARNDGAYLYGTLVRSILTS